MLVNCPRCGFTQPQDKYCARCGVDMETFRPPKPSFAKRTFGNPVFQITVVLGIAGAIGFGIYQRRVHEIEERVNFLKSGGAQVARSQSSTRTEENNEASAAAPTAEDVPRELLSDESVPETTAEAVATATAPLEKKELTAPTKPTDPNAKNAPPKKGSIARFTYAEVNRQVLAQIFEDSRGTGQFNSFGDYVAGILPEAQRRLGGRDIKVLGREEKPITTQQPVQFFQGIHQGDPENEMGFTYYLELSEGDGGASRGNLEISRSWRVPPSASAPQPTMQKSSFPAMFELPKGSAFFLSGMLSNTNLGFMPRTNLMEADMGLLSVTPFQILRSNEFRALTSEYVLFIEFE